MTTTPEPAVSPAPDTDALRAYLRRTIGGDFERRLIAADLLDDDDALSVLRVFEDVVPAIEREITSRHQAFVLMLADAKAERDDRIAGLRADLDRARAERDALSRMLRGMARRASELRHSELMTLQAMADAMRYQWDPNIDWVMRLFAVMAGVKRIVAERDELRAELARSAGARTIPDDAAELVAKRMLRIKLYGVALSTRYDWQAHRQWTQQLTADERADWLRDARALLADLGATPTTRPAPAAVGGLREEYAGFFHPGWPDPLHFQYGDDPRANAARWYAECVEQQPQIEVRRRLISDWVQVDVTAPAAPQAPAKPTKSSNAHGEIDTAAREETAPRNGPAFKPEDLLSQVPDVPDPTGPLVDFEELDTAPPAWTGHNVTVAHLNGYYARCDTCPHVYDAKSQEDAEDWADAHRADNLIPARPAPPVDGDTDA